MMQIMGFVDELGHRLQLPEDPFVLFGFEKTGVAKILGQSVVGHDIK